MINSKVLAAAVVGSAVRSIEASWSYAGNHETNGPTTGGGWAAATCNSGVAQSPVFLKDDVLSGLAAAADGDLVAFNTTHTLSKLKYSKAVATLGEGQPLANAPTDVKYYIEDSELENSASMVFGDKTYYFHEMKLHAASEHTFGAAAASAVRRGMELQMMFKTSATPVASAIVSVFFDAGTTPTDATLQTNTIALVNKFSADAAVPEAEVASTHADFKKINPMNFLAGAQGMTEAKVVHYVGSHTTPDCAADVKWFLFTKPIVVDQSVLTGDGSVGDIMKASEKYTVTQGTTPVTYPGNSRAVMNGGERHPDATLTASLKNVSFCADKGCSSDDDSSSAFSVSAGSKAILMCSVAAVALMM